MSDPTIADLQRTIEELQAKLAQANSEKEAVASGEAPKYRLLQPCYIEDTLWPEGTEIALANGCPPNEHMEPLNEAAKKALIPILKGISKKSLAEQIYEAKLGLHERDRLAALPLADLKIIAETQSAAAAAEAEAVVFPKKDDTVPIMPNHVLPGQRPRGRPKKVLDAKIPTADGRPKAPVLGTVVLQGKDGAINTGGGLTP